MTVAFPPALVDALAAAETEYCAKVSHKDPRDTIHRIYEGTRYSVALLAPFLERVPAARVLEVGSGTAFVLCELINRGVDAVGIEPGSSLGFIGRYERALALLEANGIRPAEAYLKSAVAEDLPFESGSFDLVYSTSVLEHVADARRALSEAVRVLKPAGTVVLTVPNFNSFYEAHYAIPWVPYLLNNKTLAKWYVSRVWRRDPSFVDELNFTTPGKMRALLRELGSATRGDVYPALAGRLSVISSVHYYLSLGHVQKHPALSFVASRPWLALAVTRCVRVLSEVLAALGLASDMRVLVRRGDHRPGLPSSISVGR